MNLRHKITLAFLFLGFIFSSTIRIRFNMAHGFEFHNIWITWIPSIFDFALLSSKEQALTSTFLGYSFFAISGFLMLDRKNVLKEKNKMLVTFIGITAVALLFELTSLAQDLFTSYYGQHLRIGLLLMVFGLMVFNVSTRNNRNNIIIPLNQKIEGYH